MLHSRPDRASSNADSVSRAAQRLGRALAAADITEPFRYQRDQQAALRAAAAAGGMPNGTLTEVGMNAAARYLEALVAR